MIPVFGFPSPRSVSTFSGSSGGSSYLGFHRPATVVPPSSHSYQSSSTQHRQYWRSQSGWNRPGRQEGPMLLSPPLYKHMNGYSYSLYRDLGVNSKYNQVYDNYNFG